MGDVCVFNTDCLSGMYCSTGICTCLSDFVSRDSYCYASLCCFLSSSLLAALYLSTGLSSRGQSNRVRLHVRRAMFRCLA